MDIAVWLALAPAVVAFMMMLLVEAPSLARRAWARIAAIADNESALSDLENVAKDKAFDGGALVGLVSAFAPQSPVPHWLSVVLGLMFCIGAWRVAAIAKNRRRCLERRRLDAAAEAIRATWRD